MSDETKTKAQLLAELAQMRRRMVELETVRVELERVKEDLKESEEKYQALFKTLAQGIVYQNAEGQITSANPAAEQILGLSRDQLLGRTSLDPRWHTIHEDGSAFPRETHPSMVALCTGQEIHDTVMGVFNPQTETYRWISVNAVPQFKPGQDTPYQVYTTFGDITRRKRAEDALREGEARYRNFFENVAVGVAVVDMEGYVIDANDADCRFLGYPRSELLGMHFTQFTHPEDIDLDADLFQSLVAGQRQAYEIEKRYIRKDRRVVWGRLAVSMIRDHQDHPMYTLVVCVDITKRRQAETSLRRERDRAQTYLDIAGVILVTLDAQGDVTLINRRGCEIFGYGPEEMIGRHWFDNFLPVSIREDVKIVFDRLMTGEMEPVEYYENPVLIKGGGERIIAWHNVVLRDEEDDPIGTLSSGEDITERKQAEAALRVSEKRLRQVVENMPVMMDAMDEDYNILVWNRECERVTGYSASEMVGNPRAMEILYPDVAYREQMKAAALTLGSDFRNEEWTLTCKDGAEKTIRWSNISARFPIPGWYTWAVGVDVTERVRAEEERARLTAQIQEQARRMAQILATVPTGILLLDAGGRVLQANAVGERDLGALADAEVGDRLAELGNHSLAELLTSPPTKGLWHEVKTDERTFEVIARPVENGAEPEHWVLVTNDVTQEREIRVQLQRQERLAAVGQLAAGIAHDFNNIMATIILYIRLLQQAEGLRDRDRERLATINQQAWHATRMIEQILDFSRRTILERRPIDLLPLLKEQIKLLKHTLPEHIQIDLDYEQDEYTIRADPTRMQQVLTNLAVNARDAMPEGGHLYIALERLVVEGDLASPLPEMDPGDWIRVMVSDTGTGIPVDVLPHIFEPFFTTKAPGEGSGLGLAQVHGIVGLHGGHIDVDTHVGQGTTFMIYLPALKVRLAAVSFPDIATMPHGQGQVILIVEDSDEVRDALQASLEELNYQVLAVPNGQEALSLMEERGPHVDLVLSDVVMPVMGGIALFHALRKKGWYMPVILLTGHAMDEELEALCEKGLASWLAKPPKFERLAQEITRALRA